MKILILCGVLLILSNLEHSECKRGGGGGRGRVKSTGGGGWLWGSSNKKSSSSSSRSRGSGAAESAPIKASAPEPAIKKQTSHVQQSSPGQQTPIGWNVPGSNQAGYKGGHQTAQESTHRKHTSHLQHSGVTQQKPAGWNIQGNNQQPTSVVKQQTSNLQQSSPGQQRNIGWNKPDNNHHLESFAQKNNAKSQFDPLSQGQQRPVGWNIQNQQSGFAVKQQTSHLQQSSQGQQKPVGWNLQGNNHQSGSAINKQTSPLQQFQPGQQRAVGINAQGNSQKTAVKKQTSNVQQSGPGHQTPIGWNIPASNQPSYKGGHQTGHQPLGTAHNTGPVQGRAYNTQSGYPQQNGGYNGFPQQQHSGYSGHPQHGYAGHPQQGYGGVGQHHGYGGYGQSPGYGGFGQSHGYGGYGQSHGSSFGGYGGGGGFGGMGGLGGGYGGMGGMYAMKQKSSLFSARTIGSVVAGMMIYHVTSSMIGGLTGGMGSKRPYNVYNYYNQPAEKEEIKLPPNILTMCEGSSTSLCTAGTTAICTTNNTVLCVTTMAKASPCAEENNALCINTTISCKDNPMCENMTAPGSQSPPAEAPVNLPCFNNLTMDINLLNETGSVGGDGYKYCVTAMAIAGPEYKTCPEEKGEVDGYKSVLAGKHTWMLTLETMKRPYNIFNYHHPTEASMGEIVMPLDVLVPCIENATKLCAPGIATICTTFGEIMCLETLATTTFCEKYNTTCSKIQLPCVKNDTLCDNRTEEETSFNENNETLVNIDLPCFANITVNSHVPNFDIRTFNGTLSQALVTSFTYHYRYCVISLGLPGLETDVCLVKSPS